GRGEEDTRRTPVPRVSGAVMINPHPAFGENVNALDGVHRRTFGDRRRRASVGVARMDTVPKRVGRVDDRLPALAKQPLDELHLGVRRPEDPYSGITHEFLPSVPRP